MSSTSPNPRHQTVPDRGCPITIQDAILLLHSLNGVSFATPITAAEMPSFLSNTVWSLLLETPWGDGATTLQEVIDSYNSPSQWGPEITGDPRVKFSNSLRSLKPQTAAALYSSAKHWWANRQKLGESAHARCPETLHLDEYFLIIA